MSLMDLFRPRADTALRAPREDEGASITSVLLHIPSPRLAQIADNDLAPLINAAIEQDGGIHQVGLAPKDLEIQDGRFAARCDLWLTTSKARLEIRIEGDIDARGFVETSSATLLAHAA